MNIGVPREIKNHEYRVGLTPDSVKSYVQRGHHVAIETQAGVGSGHSDEEYRKAGAQIASGPEEIWTGADMIIKVKEPLESEYQYFREGLILFTYLHLAANKPLTQALMDSGVTAIAYETIELPDGRLPCLTPMSEIAGRLSIQEGAKYLEKSFGGRGILLGGVPGVHRGSVTILGGGTVGTNACKIAVGIGANVTILDINPRRLAYLDDIFGSSITTLYATEANIHQAAADADILVGAVLIPGKAAPKLITRDIIQTMRPGAVLVDVAVDQGGCAQTSRPTTHDDPIFIVDNVVHYCVANMPGAVAYTSTQALTSVTLPYGLSLADHGVAQSVSRKPDLALGLNIYQGECVNQAVAQSLDLPWKEL
ncbi:alanine dehydrogenase [Spirochaeta lutea]|uniref:Alanine dehydrogenase n=1 Tax=Spirochaeta lutea TaxID=1480694 RepID=A0A098QVL2_9SPIO|nr:alanine dehydrogenase [Spirochaeta lutea]KGE71850.1 alanine dehydrogenase [Spirochaeta lutea]